jgi:hypothetical protein
MKSDMVNIMFHSNLPGWMGRSCKKSITCQNREIFKYVVSKRVSPFQLMIAAGNLMDKKGAEHTIDCPVT